LLALGLGGDFVPPTQFSKRLRDVPGGERAVLQLLAGAADPDLQLVMAQYELLTAPERRAVSIDVLIAAAKVKDPHDLYGKIAAELSRQSVSTTSMIASLEAPRVMKAMARRAKGVDGHADTKLLLQTAGVAPTPKNSTTIISNSNIDARRQSQVNVQVPRLEDITRMLDSDDLGILPGSGSSAGTRD
jgi:hypothetical protein